MVRFSSLVVALAFAAVAGGCASPVTRLDRGNEPAWRDTGTPPRPAGIDRLARYYVDEEGGLWDERGRKYEDAQ